MTRRLAFAAVLLAGCTWSNSLYQARLLSRNAMTAERERRPAEASQLWGQVVVKAESAYARTPLGARGAEALWLGGHAAVKLNDCARAIPRLQGAMSADPAAAWRQELLFELAMCEEPLGGPTASSLYRTVIASATDSLTLQRARLRLGHTLVLRHEWNDALEALDNLDTLPAHVDRALAFASLGRGSETLRELARPLATADTSVRWIDVVEALARNDGASADVLLDRLRSVPTVTEPQYANWLLAAARVAFEVDPVAADRRLQLLATGSVARTGAEASLMRQQLRIVRATTLAELRASVDTAALGTLSDDGPGAGRLAQLVRLAHLVISRADATPAGSPAGDLTMFALAEFARDSLGSPRLGSWFFSQIEQQWPSSPYIAKALMARSHLEPDSAEALRARLVRLTTNPYVAAANGDVAGRVRMTQLEDSLGRFIDRLWSRPDSR